MLLTEIKHNEDAESLGVAMRMRRGLIWLVAGSELILGAPASAQDISTSDDPGLARIVSQFPSGDYEAQDPYLASLAKRSDALELASKLIQSSDQAAIKLGCELAAKLGPAAAPLRDKLGDALIRVRRSGETNAVVSSAVVDALVAMGPPGAVQGLALASRSSSEGKFEGFQVLEGLGPDATVAIPFLLNLLIEGSWEDYSKADAADAVGALAAMREASLPHLCRTIAAGVAASLGSKQRLAAERALFAIKRANYAAPQPAECIKGAAQSPDVSLRANAMGAAGSLAGEGAEIILARGLLHDQEPRVREESAAALKELGDRALPTLRNAILSDSEAIQEKGWFALSWLEKTPAKEVLLRSLETAKAETVRVQATLMAGDQFSLSRRGLKNLPSAMKDDSEYSRARAVELLTQAPPHDPITLAVLRDALVDPEQIVRTSAYEVIVEANIYSPKISGAVFASIPLLSRADPANDDPGGRTYDTAGDEDMAVKALASFVDRHTTETQSILAGHDVQSKIVVLRAVQQAGAGTALIDDLLSLFGAADFDLKVAAHEAIMSNGTAVTAALKQRLSGEASIQPDIFEILALADSDGTSATRLAEVARMPSPMQGPALAALIVMSARVESAKTALEETWPHLSEESRAAGVQNLRRFDLLRGERAISWVLSVLKDPQPAWDEALLLSVDFKDVSEEQVGAVRSLALPQRIAILGSLAREAPSMVNRSDVSPLVADPATLKSGLEIIAALPNDIAEKLELTGAGVSRWAKQSFQERLALARSSSAFNFDSRLKLWRDGLNDSSEAVRTATLTAIASLSTLEMLSTQFAATENENLRAIAKKVRDIVASEGSPETQIQGIGALRVIAPLDDSLIEVLEQLVLFPTNQEVAIVAVLELGRSARGRSALKMLGHGVTDPVIDRYIARALESPGMAYATSPPFWGFENHFPRLVPWPPGQFADRVTFETSEVGGYKTTLGSYLQRLRKALRMAGYPEPSLYAIPGGFAAALAPERLDVPKAQRWTFGKLPISVSEPAKYFRQLLLGGSEKYRWLVFYATSMDFGAPNKTLHLEEARAWARKGYAQLPIGIASRPATSYSFGVLSFEFAKDDTAPRALASPSSVRPLRELLRETGLYQSLFSPIQIADRGD